MRRRRVECRPEVAAWEHVAARAAHSPAIGLARHNVAVTARRILVVDNYDSFVYTLEGYLEQLGARTTVILNDEVTPARALELAAEHTAVLI